MTVNLKEILEKLGWDDGFQIPIANDENKELEQELAKLTLRKTKAKHLLENLSGRVNALTENYKYVEHEHDQTQKLITAHKQQYEVLQNHYLTSKSELENIRLLIKKAEKQLTGAEQMEGAKKVDLSKCVSKVDQLKLEMEWDTEALKAWDESLKKRDEDTGILKKFSREDEIKYNELEARRLILQSECLAKRDTIKRIAAESRNYEMVLERSGKVIKQQVAHRESLINQWKDAVKMLQQRDVDIFKAQEDVQALYEAISKQEDVLEEERIFLNDQKRVNREIELELENVNSINCRMKRELAEFTQINLLMKTDRDMLKRQVAKVAQHLESVRLEGKMLGERTTEMKNMRSKCAEETQSLLQKHREIDEMTSSSKERLRKLEHMLESEQRLYNSFVIETERINNKIFRKEQFLKEQKDITKIIEIDLNDTISKCNELRKIIRVLSKDLDKLKEVVYDMEFRIDDIEKKLSAMAEEEKVDDATKDALYQQINSMEETLAKHKEVQRVLQAQVDQLQEETRRVSKYIIMDKETILTLQNRCENIMLEFENGTKQIAAAKQTTQEKQVEENMLLLKIDQLEKEKKKEEKDILDLEALRLNLDQAIKERQIEIDTKKTITLTKRRNLDEERGRLRADIGLVRVKIDRMKKTYYIACSSLGKDEEGNPLSVSHFRIKNAQEKFMLQQQGDDLDKKIRTAEKEIVAMENTLKLVNLTNSSFKNSLSNIKEEDEEMKKLKALEEQYRVLYQNVKKMRKQIEVSNNELQEYQNRLREIQKTIEERQNAVTELEEEIEVVRRQEFEKTTMLKRTDCAIKRALRKIGKIDLSKYHKDLEIRQLQSGNKQVTSALKDLSLNFSEMEPQISYYTTEYKIKLPVARRPPSSESSFSTLSPCSSSKEISTSTYELDSSGGVSTVNLALKL